MALASAIKSEVPGTGYMGEEKNIAVHVIQG